MLLVGLGADLRVDGDRVRDCYRPVVLSKRAHIVDCLCSRINVHGYQPVRRTVCSLVAGPIAIASAALACVSMIAPLVSGQVEWGQAVNFHLSTPFPGWFGSMTSLMAGLYLVGFGAPAFEAATCHVGETINPARNVPLAMLA